MRLRGSIAVGLATIVVAGPAFAQLPDPAKQLPQVVPVPTVELPAVVPLPTVVPPASGGGDGGVAPSVPSLPVPAIPVPSVPSPAIPDPGAAGSLPGGAPPSSSPRRGSGSSGGAGSRGSSSGGAGSGASSGTGSAGSSSGAGSGSAGSSSDGAGSGASGADGAPRGSSSPRGDGESSSAERGPLAVPILRLGDIKTGPAKRERRLREAVARAGGCLDRLARDQRRVLTLRAGVGGQPARSRAGVARRLDLTLRRVTRLETTGLRRLRTLTTGGACGAPAITLVTGDPAQGTIAGAALPGGTATGGTRAAGDDRGTNGGARGSADPCGDARGRGDSGAGASSGDSDGGAAGSGAAPRGGGTGDACGGPDAGGIKGATQINLPAAATPPGGVDLLVPLLLLALAGAAFVTARVVRRDPTPAPVEAAPEPEVREPSYRAPATGPRWDEEPPDWHR